MAVPVDPDAGVGESFVAAIERDVIIDFAFVVFCKLFRARHSGFFVSGEEKDDVALGFYVGCVECADGGEQRFDISRIVADARGINTSVTNSGFDL